jgi:hypothetical protein
MIKEKLTIESVQKYLLEANGVLTKASELANIKYDTFNGFVRRHKIPYNSKLRVIITETKEELQEAYDRLGKASLVAKEFNRSSNGILRKMKELGVITTPRLLHTVDDDFFSRDTEEAFYWAGFIAADGNVNAGGNRYNKDGSEKEIRVLAIHLQDRDKAHLERFVKDIKFSGEPKFFIKKANELTKVESKMNRIEISSVKIVNDLKRFGITPRKSLTYVCPDEIVNHPLFYHFLRGYFDGDGSVWHNTSNNCLVFLLLGTSTFLNSCRDILIKNNIVKPKVKIFQR